MLLAYCALLSIPVGWLRRGRLRNLEQVPMKRLWLPIAAFLLEALIGPLTRLAPARLWLWALVLMEYLLLGAFLWGNRALTPIRVLALGTAVNFLVISLNGWRMPVSRAALELPELSGLVSRIQNGTLAEYVLIDEGTRLWWLGDVLHFSWIPRMSIASVGDLFLGAGVFWLIQRIMVTVPRDGTPPG